MSRMARPRELDFSTSVNNAEERRDRRKRAGVLFSETSENISKDDNDNGKEVIIVVRDKKSLSLALRRLQCCSTCFSDNGSGRCKCGERKQDSTVSVISSGSLNCNKCQRFKDVEDTFSQGSVDEVDGSHHRKNSTAVIVDAFFKLAFLKVLLVDIGISLGDTVTDFFQGFNLIVDFSDGSLRYSSLSYGLAIILTSWLPLLVVSLHIGTSPGSGDSSMFRHCRSVTGLLGLLAAVLAFPLIPTLLYALLMLTPRQSSLDRRRYKRLERRAHEVKSICGSIEAPIQLGLLLFLMIRGILTLPWNESPSTQCVTDSLGRVACLPSVPMASILFSLLSIIKAMFDLNIYPLVREYETCSATVRMSYDLLLRFLPCFLSNALFRIAAITLMFVYLDWWSVIPCVILFFLNLMTFGVSFKRFSSSPRESICGEDMNSVQLNRLSTMDFANRSLQFGSSHSDLPRTPTDEEKMKTVVGWVPPNDLPRASTHLKPYKYDQIGWNQTLGILSPPTPSPQVEVAGDRSSNIITSQPDGAGVELRVNLMERMQSLISNSSNKTDTPSYINEENTSIFLNAITGMFFPSCHTHLEAIGPDLAGSDPQTFFIRNKERQEKLVMWQSSIYQRQVYLFNSLLMIVLIVLWILVSGVQSFNYNTNVINHFWFTFIMIMMMISGIISILLTWSLTRRCSKSSEPQSQPSHQESESFDFSSQRAGSRSGKLHDSLSPRHLSVSTIKCIGFLIIVLIPIIFSLIFFSSVHKTDPYVFLINQSEGVDNIDLSIITAFPVKYPESSNMIVSQGKLEMDCNKLGGFSSFEGRILIINATKAACKTLLLEGSLYDKAVNSAASGIILLDDTPASEWRVSSPLAEKIHGLVKSNHGSGEDIPFLMIRELDWRKFDSKFLSLKKNNKKIFIVWNDPKLIDLKDVFSCSNNKSVTIEASQVRVETHCSDGKHLYSDGIIKEKICIRGRCSVFGKDCPHSEFDNLKNFSEDLVCDSLNDIDLEISRRDSPPLEPGTLSLTPSSDSEYCCYNDDNQEYNSTFIEVLGSGCFDNWRGVTSYLTRCEIQAKWSDWIRGSCVRENRQHYRLCLVEDGGCNNVIKQYYNTLCGSEEVLPLCRSSRTVCM